MVSSEHEMNCSKEIMPHNGSSLLYNVTPKDNVSLLTALANQIHRYQVRLKGIDALPPDEPKQLQIGHDMGNHVWINTPNGWCTSLYVHGHVTSVINPQNVLVDGIPRHVRDLRLVMGTNTLESQNDSKLSTQSVRMIIINNAYSDPPEVSNSDATDDTSADESSEEGLALLWRSTRCKRPALGCYLWDYQISYFMPRV